MTKNSRTTVEISWIVVEFCVFFTFKQNNARQKKLFLKAFFLLLFNLSATLITEYRTQCNVVKHKTQCYITQNIKHSVSNSKQKALNTKTFLAAKVNSCITATNQLTIFFNSYTAGSKIFLRFKIDTRMILLQHSFSELKTFYINLRFSNFDGKGTVVWIGP